MINIDWTNCIIGIKNKFTSSGRAAIPMYALSIKNSYLIPTINLAYALSICKSSSCTVLMHKAYIAGYLSIDSTQSAIIALLAVILWVIEAAILFYNFYNGANISLASLNS